LFTAMTATRSIPASRTRRARTRPCRPSGTAVRKTVSLSFRSETAGAVAEGETIGTPAGIDTALAAAMVMPEAIGPMIAATLSAWTSRVMTVTPTCGLVWSSASTICSRRPPSTPPAALISSKASAMPARIGGTKAASPPEADRITPMRTGSAWARAMPGMARPAVPATSAARRVRRKVVIGGAPLAFGPKQ
jgi:hypothetical protein